MIYKMRSPTNCSSLRPKNCDLKRSPTLQLVRQLTAFSENIGNIIFRKCDNIESHHETVYSRFNLLLE